MAIKTKYLGEIEIDEGKIIAFEAGLPGFPEENQFVILDLPGNDILQILQSVRTPDLAFIVANPHHFYKEYEFALDAPILETLNVQDESDIVVLAIMTIEEPFHKSTINLQAPLIINSRTKRAKQYILPHDEYEMKAKISLPAKQERGGL